MGGLLSVTFSDIYIVTMENELLAPLKPKFYRYTGRQKKLIRCSSKVPKCHKHNLIFVDLHRAKRISVNFGIRTVLRRTFPQRTFPRRTVSRRIDHNSCEQDVL